MTVQTEQLLRGVLRERLAGEDRLAVGAALVQERVLARVDGGAVVPCELLEEHRVTAEDVEVEVAKSVARMNRDWNVEASPSELHGSSCTVDTHPHPIHINRKHHARDVPSTGPTTCICPVCRDSQNLFANKTLSGPD